MKDSIVNGKRMFPDLSGDTPGNAIHACEKACTRWIQSRFPWITCLLFLLFWRWPVEAQPIITAPRPASTNEPDPLAAFMVSQPPIDTTSPIVPVVEFEPNVITNGQASVYRVVLNALEQSVDWPDFIPEPEGCLIRKGASGQFLQNLGSIIAPNTSFLYHVQPQSNGTFTLPAYTVRVRGATIRIPEATLMVVPPDSRAVEVSSRIQLSADGTDFFVGQNVDIQVEFPGKPDGTVQTLSQVEVVGDGLIVDRNFRAQRVEMRVKDGVSRPIYIYSALITPMRSGRTEVTAHGYTFGNRLQGRVVLPGGKPLPASQPGYKLVDSDPLILNILPLPHISRPPGFTGAIGTFSLDPPTLSTNRVRAGDLMTLSLTVRGTGNLERILPPGLQSQPQWQVFPAKQESVLPAVIRQRGFVTFEYQLIPLDDTIAATPSIPFCYFDPESRSYVDLTVDPLPVTVESSPSTAPTTGHASLIDARSFLRELLKTPDEPTALADTLGSMGSISRSFKPMHHNAWFAGVQLIPATLLGGLWFWDRRRRFFEQHPEVLVRRRARRAIRRHARRARRAARQEDVHEFLHHAIQGFREACAPAAPADPRALVCEDILNTLPPTVRGEPITSVIRQLFCAANDWRFGNRPLEGSELLNLANAVDQRLEELRKTL